MTDPDGELRKIAIEQLKKKRDFQAHLIAYVTVNLFLNVIWFITGAGFYWPVFPLLGWGIGLAFHAWDVYSPERLTEDKIQSEMQRLRRRAG